MRQFPRDALVTIGRGTGEITETPVPPAKDRQHAMAITRSPNGGLLERVAALANHASTRTMHLYDCRHDHENPTRSGSEFSVEGVNLCAPTSWLSEYPTVCTGWTIGTDWRFVLIWVNRTSEAPRPQRHPLPCPATHPRVNPRTGSLPLFAKGHGQYTAQTDQPEAIFHGGYEGSGRSSCEAAD